MANVDTSLQYIRNTVRRITRSPDESLLTTVELDAYINRFILFKMPENIKLSVLRKVLTFYTTPNVDEYKTNTTDVNDPLYDFINRYTNVHPPVFFAGIQGSYYQNRDQFYADWPQTNSVSDIQQNGDGVTLTFEGTAISAPMLQHSVVFTTLDANNNPIILVDYPSTVNPHLGILGLVNVPQTNPFTYGFIDYVTGEFTVNFPVAPGLNASIYLENINYQPAKPFSMLFYDTKFTIRPVPDKTYVIQINVDALPTEMLDSAQLPDMNQWADYYALGASMDVFRDRMDMDSMQQLKESYDKQEALTRRPTLINSANVRTPSFYARRNYWGSWFNGSNWPM